MSSSDLQALFSNLRPRSVQDRKSISPAPKTPSYEAGSYLTSKPLPSSQSPGIMTPSDYATPGGELPDSQQAPNSTAQNLLSLLNFGGQTRTTESSQTPLSRTVSGNRQDANNISASDLIPPIMSPWTVKEPNGKMGQDVEEIDAVPNPLSSLLNQHVNRESTSSTPTGISSATQIFQGLSQSVNPERSQSSLGTSENKPLFTYTNPFEALNASRTQTPTARQPALSESDPAVATSLTTPVDMAVRKKLTPKPRSTRNESSPQPEQQGLSEQEDVSKNIHSRHASSTVDRVKNSDKHEQAKQKKRSSNIDAANGDDGSGEWEDADESAPQRVVPVYNFPIKAFVSFTLNLNDKSDITIRKGSIMEISRLKKEFDQLDRSLACATSKYIGYAFTKHGGLRIIRQEDGSDRSVFKNSHDRVFNVTFCTDSLSAPPSPAQAILGTGVSGAVYYAIISEDGRDLFEENDLESSSLVFPPWPQADENTAGGLLKTRAKRSSRHPEYFAIGRGRSIHIVWPAIAKSTRYRSKDQDRSVNIEKYYHDHPASIQTGKAGKDFNFSEDDTAIVSLDKTGRLRFWDIRPLLENPGASASKSNSQVVDTPIFTLSTVSPTEKSWPTSVQFVDKSRPFVKGGPLRYVLVGLRQNHTLQIWDIALNKAVQELNFPHESETDAICSLNYHPASGIIVVGHPTRNSIFLVHLSAPKYGLSSQLSQAAYITHLAAKDGEVATPDSTACFAGIREISLAEKGELRSIELLPVQKASDSSKSATSPKPADTNATLFELYVVHSRGVTCLAINREDLGWNAENKVIEGIDAKKEGLVQIRDLKLGSVVEEPARSKSPVKDTHQSTKASKRRSKKATPPPEEVPQSVEEASQAPAESPSKMESVPVSTSDNAPQEVTKESKKSKKKAAQNAEQGSTKPAPRSVSPVKSETTAIKTTDQSNRGAQQDAPTSNETVEETVKREIEKVEQAVAAEFRKEFASLQENIYNDRTALDQSSLTRQEAIIRLVSSSLSTNVEKSLSRIVTQKIESDVLPALLQATSTQISDILGQRLEQIISQEITTNLSSSVNRSLESTSKDSISNTIVHRLSSQLEKQVADTINNSIIPVCQSIAHSAADQSSATLKSYLAGQLQQIQADREADVARLEKLGQALQGMASTLQAMSNSQVAFQEQILQDRQVNSQSASRQVSTARASPSTTVVRPVAVKAKSKAEIELEDVSTMMEEGRYEEGTIKWLQSSQPTQLFDQVFVRFTPEYLATEVSPLVAFSVAVTVANALENNLERRIEWISTAFDSVDVTDPEMTDLSQHAPALISSIIQKLESLYMTLAEQQQHDSILKAIPALVKKARGMKALFVSKAQDA